MTANRGRRAKCTHCGQLVEQTITTYVHRGERLVRWRGCLHCYADVVEIEQLRFEGMI